MKLRTFTVIGHGPFPLDMLRYDECWPRDSRSAQAIETPVDREERRTDRPVTLQSHRLLAPTAGRWESFGWKIVAADY